MSGSLVDGGSRSSPHGPSAIGEVRASCPTARWALAVVGFFGYLFPGAMVGLAVSKLIRAADVPTTMPIRFAIVFGPVAFAVWRGATVAAAVRPDGLYIRNRWRRTVVPFGEIERVELDTSPAYTLVSILVSIRMIAWQYTAVQPEFLDRTEMLFVYVRGRRRPRAVSATLGMALHLERMQPFLDALAAVGHPVELGPSIDADAPEDDTPEQN